MLQDHLSGRYAAAPLLAMVAAATERLRVGTFVLNVCLRHPAVLARDLATVDGGRHLLPWPRAKPGSRALPST